MKTKLFGIAMLALFTIFSCKEKAHEAHDTEEAVEVSAPDYAAFDKKVAVIRALYQAHMDEDIEAMKAMVSDTVQWSPPNHSGNEWLDKEAFFTAIKGYHDGFENIKFTEGIELPDRTVNAYWSGSVFTKETATIEPDVIRVYGTWTAIHTESGKDIVLKFFALISVDDDGKVSQASEYFDLNGLAVQIAAE
jgi:ketosteroid isomerase-like protein